MHGLPTGCTGRMSMLVASTAITEGRKLLLIKPRGPELFPGAQIPSSAAAPLRNQERPLTAWALLRTTASASMRKFGAPAL